jgi:hypothetical protein
VAVPPSSSGDAPSSSPSRVKASDAAWVLRVTGGGVLLGGRW